MILDQDILRKVLDALYDGEPTTAMYLVRIPQFKQQHEIFLWLHKNKLFGKKLIHFFEDQGGFIDGINYIINSIEKMHERIKADRLI